MMVLRNLIGNALKFTPSGGTIHISCKARAGEIQITVADTGVGMSPETIEKLFSVGSRSSEDGTAGEKGTGLGLPLCKDIVEKNRGKLWVESTFKEAFQFHFTLPIGPETSDETT